MVGRRFIRSAVGLVLLTAFIVGCARQITQAHESTIAGVREHVTDPVYISDTTPSDCQLCGEGKGTLLPAYWGEDNIGIIDLNTFRISHISINEYDDHGRRIKNGWSGSSFNMLTTGEDGMSVWGSTDNSRGYYSGQASMKSHIGLDLEEVSGFLCTGCLNTLLDECYDETYYNLGIVNFKTREILLLEKRVTAFVFDNFYIDCNYYEDEPGEGEYGFDLLIFYCPPRYKSS